MTRRKKQDEDQHDEAGGVAVAEMPEAQAAEPTPTPSLPADDPRFATLKALVEDVDEKKARFEDADEARKEAKAAFENATLALYRFSKKVTHPEAMPLFDGTANGAAPAEHPADDGAWRDVPLAEALEGVSETLLAKLTDGARISTVGDLADWTKQEHNRLTNLAGIGQAAATKIENALDAFWAKRRSEQLAAGQVEHVANGTVAGDATAEQDEAAE